MSELEWLDDLNELKFPESLETAVQFRMIPNDLRYSMIFINKLDKDFDYFKTTQMVESGVISVGVLKGRVVRINPNFILMRESFDCRISIY